MAEINPEVQEDSTNAEETTNSTEEVKTVDKPVETAETAENEVEKEESNGKADSNEEPSAELINKIRKQVEFYFGDVNMQRDRFLIEQTKLDEGWVPMTVMLNFKILASLTKDIELILKSLEVSELIEISEDRKKIRRRLDKPLPVYDDEYRKAQEARTIYLKGFPKDSTMEKLKNHFESGDNNTVETIIMRKYKKGKDMFFKGSIFLQFKTLDDAKVFMEQESVKYNDTELLKLWSADYLASKEKEKDERRQKKAKNELNNLKADSGKGSKNQKNGQEKKKFPKGCIFHISNIEKEIPREEIKAKFIELEADVAYVDYNTGDTEGWVRLQGENSAVEFLKKLDSDTVKVQDCEIKCKLIEGEEEEAYLVKIQENMANHRLNRRDKGRNMRKGFKRRHSPHRDGNSKKTRSDA